MVVCVLFPLYVALIDLALSKKKMREEKRRKKMRPIKTESDDGCEGQTSTASLSATISDNTPALLQSVKEEWACPPTHTHTHTYQSLQLKFTDWLMWGFFVHSRAMEESQNSPDMVEEIAISFFHLLEDILRQENLASSSLVCSTKKGFEQPLLLHW